jgi:hypothetical protein
LKKNKENPNPLLSLSSLFSLAQPPSLFFLTGPLPLLAQLARSGPPPLLSLSQPTTSLLSCARTLRPNTPHAAHHSPAAARATSPLFCDWPAGPACQGYPLPPVSPSLLLFWTSSAAGGHLLRIPRPFPPSSRHQGALMHRFYPPHQFSIRFSLIKRRPLNALRQPTGTMAINGHCCPAVAPPPLLAL